MALYAEDLWELNVERLNTFLNEINLVEATTSFLPEIEENSNFEF